MTWPKGVGSLAAPLREGVFSLPAVLLVLPPVLWLAWACGAALIEHGPATFDRISWTLLSRSLTIAAGATGLALLMGGLYGWFALRYRVPGRRWLLAAGLLPLLLPPYAAAHAWLLLLLREGRVNQLLLQWGVISRPVSAEGCPTMTTLILAWCYWPVVGVFVLLAARSVPRELEDTARLHLPEAAAARWAAWPALRSALGAGGLLVFLLVLADFGVPNTLGVFTYPVEIVNRYLLDRDAGAVARFALPLLVVVIPLVVLQRRSLDRASLGAETTGEAPLLRSPWGIGFALLGTGVVLLFSVVFPLVALVLHSLPLATYGAVWAEGQDHLGYTLLTAGAGAAVAVGGALLYGQPAQRRGGGILDLLLTLPYALPASLVGIAMVQLLNRPGPLGAVYESADGLIWTYVALFYPFAHRTVQLGWKQVDPALLDEGRVLGAGPWVQLRHAAWPVLRPWAVGAGGLIALLAAREIDATTLVRAPHVDTIAFRIYDYLHFAPGPELAALCVLLVGLNFAAVLGLAVWAARRD